MEKQYICQYTQGKLDIIYVRQFIHIEIELAQIISQICIIQSIGYDIG